MKNSLAIFGTNTLLQKLSIENFSVCRLCQSQPETLVNLFVNCATATDLWKSRKVWIHTHTCNQKYKVLATNIILEHLCNDNCYLPINAIITVTKYYIFSCAVNKRTPNV